MLCFLIMMLQNNRPIKALNTDIRCMTVYAALFLFQQKKAFQISIKLKSLPVLQSRN